MSQKKINEHLKTLIDELNAGLYEKERSIRLNLLAILAGESTFMLGEPGTAKSLVARRISDAFDDPENKDEIKFFDYLMNQFSTPEEIFGPVSIQELKEDKYVRKTEKYLPKAQFAFLDEIWKANPAIQNALLTILNEKIFKNGVKTENVPLIGFMSASNELPEKGKGLDAIFDRFLVRILEKPISNADNFRSMISAGKNTQAKISKKLTKKIIDHISKKAECIEITDECFDVIESIRKALTNKNQSIEDESEKYIISDRRWKKIANLMRVSAYCNNRIETDIMDATLIADCIWSTERQEEEAKQIVAETIKAYGVKRETNIKDFKNEIKDFKDKISDIFYEEKVFNRNAIIKDIDGVQFYEVKELDVPYPKTHYISCQEQYDDWNGYNNFYFDSKYIGIYAKYDESTRIYTANNKKRYQVQLTEGIKRTVKRTDIQNKMMIKLFDKDANKLNNELKKAIKQIENAIKEEEKQYKANLFSDNELYSDIIFKEQIKTKTELKKLQEELAKQITRYQD